MDSSTVALNAESHNGRRSRYKGTSLDTMIHCIVDGSGVVSLHVSRKGMQTTYDLPRYQGRELLNQEKVVLGYDCKDGIRFTSIGGQPIDDISELPPLEYQVVERGGRHYLRKTGIVPFGRMMGYGLTTGQRSAAISDAPIRGFAAYNDENKGGVLIPEGAMGRFHPSLRRKPFPQLFIDHRVIPCNELADYERIERRRGNRLVKEPHVFTFDRENFYVQHLLDNCFGRR